MFLYILVHWNDWIWFNKKRPGGDPRAPGSPLSFRYFCNPQENFMEEWEQQGRQDLHLQRAFKLWRR